MSGRHHSSPAGAARLADTDALNRFLAGVERRALRIAQVATGDVEEALDLVQDAMLRLANRYADRPQAEWGPLFHRILQSAIRDWYRRSRVRRRWRTWLGGKDDADDGLDSQPSPQSAPDTVLEHAGAMARLDQALRALPLRQQQAFVLRVWEGYDTAQTASAMGCSQGSVKTHFSRATASLRQALGEHWS